MTATVNSELLRDSIEAYEDALKRMEALVAGLTAEQANFKPAPKKWSIGECLAHVNISNRLYAAKLEAAIAKARDKGLTGAPPYGRGKFLGRFILNNLRQGAAAPKVPAPGTFKPTTSTHDLQQLTAEFRQHLTSLCRVAEQADGLALGRIKFATPVAPIGRVTAAQAFEMMNLHTHRHLGQAERVKQAEGYPK
ncbi:MAG: DinB family protein [Planctomycetes bacterium]|nr:DinB family protein [Planctomycetota bacterium]